MSVMFRKCQRIRWVYDASDCNDVMLQMVMAGGDTSDMSLDHR